MCSCLCVCACAESPANVALEAVDEKQLDAYRAWAERCKVGGALAVVQLSHPGRQMPRSVGRSVFACVCMCIWLCSRSCCLNLCFTCVPSTSLAPSPIRMRMAAVPWFVVTTPRQMTGICSCISLCLSVSSRSVL